MKPTQALNLEVNPTPYQVDEGMSLTTLAAILTKRAQALAAIPPQPFTGQTLSLLIFQLGQERYGIEVQHVKEIYPKQPLTPVPRTPDFVAGIFSARGHIVSVIHLARFMGLPYQTQELDQAKIIVVTSAANATTQLEVGLLVDEVLDITPIFESNLIIAAQTQANYVRGLTAEMLVVLNLNTLLSDQRLLIEEEV